jgi:hypothetical protein
VSLLVNSHQAKNGNFKVSAMDADLTCGDIKLYVTTNLSQSRVFTALQHEDAESSSDLIQKVTTKALGVFLWVHLVTHSLLDGLSDGERLSELHHRLDSLPADL